MRGFSSSWGLRSWIMLSTATQCRPHVACFDKLTNNLDGESLGTIIEPLMLTENHVLFTTHGCDFPESLCKTAWAVHGARLEASGHDGVEGQGSCHIGKDPEEDISCIIVFKYNLISR